VTLPVMHVPVATWLLAALVSTLAVACSKSDSPSSTAAPTPSAPAFTVTFSETPVPYRTTDCSASTPQGWYTNARIQETAGIAFTPMSLTQKLDGTSASGLTESFGSRFGACSGSPFTPGTIAANGSVCGVVGVCTTASYTTYQFDVSGTDPGGRPVTFSSPVLQLAPR
jgi:hypothetical protein